VNKLLGSLEESLEKELSQRDLTEEIRKNHYSDLIDSVKNISDLLNYEIVRPLNSLRNVAFVLREEENIQLAEIIESSLKNADRSLYELSNLTFMGGAQEDNDGRERDHRRGCLSHPGAEKNHCKDGKLRGVHRTTARRVQDDSGLREHHQERR
jgi:hypothetical protein